MSQESNDTKTDAVTRASESSSHPNPHPDSQASDSDQQRQDFDSSVQNEGSTKSHFAKRWDQFSEQVRTGFTQLQTRIQSSAQGQSGGRLQAGLNWESIAHAAIQLAKSGKLAPLGTALTLLLSTWFLSDISGLYLESFLPEAPPPRSARSSPRFSSDRSGGDPVQIITSRNLFSSQGLIPGEEQPSGPIDPGVLQ